MGRRRLSPSWLGTAGGLALVLIVGVGAFRLSYSASKSTAQRDVAQRTADASTNFAADLAAEVTRLADIASGGPTSGDVALATADDDQITISTGSFGVAQGLRIPLPRSARTAVASAIDRGDSQLVVAGTPAVVYVLAPRYRADTPLTTTAQRRAGFDGFGVQQLDLANLASSLAALPGEHVVIAAGVPVLRSHDGSSDESPGGRDDGTATVFVAGGIGWTLAVDAPPVRPALFDFARSTLVCFVGGLIVASSARQRRQHDREQRDAAARSRRERLVSDLVPLVQASLDLAEIIPAGSLRLADEFDLRGIDVELIDADWCPRARVPLWIDRRRPRGCKQTTAHLVGTRPRRSIAWVRPHRPQCAADR